MQIQDFLIQFQNVQQCCLFPMYTHAQRRIHFFTIWNSISGFDNLQRFLFEASCYVVIKVRSHKQFFQEVYHVFLSKQVISLVYLVDPLGILLVPDSSYLKFPVKEFALPIQRKVCSDLEVSTILRSDSSLQCLQSVLQGV